MFQPSTSNDPFLIEKRNPESDGGESVEKHAYDNDFNVERSVYLSDVDEDQTLTPFGESTVVEGVDANVLKLPREDQRFSFVEFSPDWSLVVTITSDDTFSMWEATNKFVLMGSTRFQQEWGTPKCVAFDPYNKEAVLLCFGCGAIIRADLRQFRTGFQPSGTHIPGVSYMELIHQCKGRLISSFDHFKFSPDRTTMLYYNLDGEITAVQFKEEDDPKWMTLSKEFVLKQEPNIYISKDSILVTSVISSSEDPEPSSEKIETLFWPDLDTGDTQKAHKPVRLEGKGYLSGDGRYLLTSILATKHESTCCQIEVHRTKDVKSNSNVKRSPFAARTLSFTSNHPYMECLDWIQFKSLHANDGNSKPLIAIQQTNYFGSRLVLWNTNSNAIIYEIDLTLRKEVQRFSKVKYCWSSDCRWLGVCSIEARMVGLVCVSSGVFVWTAHVPQIMREDTGFSAVSFNSSGNRLMISLCQMIYLFEPPCLSKKPQKHPMHDNLLLSETCRRYTFFEILEIAKEWPKQVLFNILLRGQQMKSEYQDYLLDVAISLTSKSLAMICKKHEGHCFLTILDYSETSSWESLWLVIMTRWKCSFLPNHVPPLVKEIKGDQGHKGVLVFYYDNEETSNEHVALLSLDGGIKMLDLESGFKTSSEWILISDKSCFSVTQSKDRRRVISLANNNVFVIDLNEKRITNEVMYSFGLGQWWKSLLHGVKFFAYSHNESFTGQDFGEEHILFLQDRLRGFFDVSEDGETILIGWDSEKNERLVITPEKSEEQFQAEWDEAHESLHQCSMLTQDGQWLGFIDYEKLSIGDLVVRVIDTLSKRQQRIWLGSNEPLPKPSLESQPCITTFFLQVDESKGMLTTLGLGEIGLYSRLKQFSIELVHDATRPHDHQSLLEDMNQPTNLDRYGENNQPFVFNMNVPTISNFQRILIEEGEEKMEKVAKYALDNEIKVSTVYRFGRDEESNHTTFLTHAQQRKETSLVRLCLQFIKDGLFPFHSTAAMVKDSFFDLLFSYNELIGLFLKKDSLKFKAAEIMVSEKVFKSRNATSNVVFTSDTMMEPAEHFIEIATEDFQKSESRKHLGFTKDYKEGKKILACVHFHYIANACKIGLNRIVRKLLMLEVDSSIFKTEIVRATITWKWEKLWKKKWMQQLYLYLIFLAFFTFYAVKIRLSEDNLVHDKKVGLGVLISLCGAFVLTIVFFFEELMQLKTYIKDGKEVFDTYKWGLKHYFFDSQWNLLELLSYFLVLVLIPIFHGMYIFEIISKQALLVIVAIESILAWFKLWYYAQPFDRTGALVLLISNVIHDCYSFLILALVILVGFSVAFYVLFQCGSSLSRTDSSQDGEEDLIHESFGSLWRSLSTLFYAMVGTFEVEVYYNHPSLSCFTTFTFMLYIALEMIVMLNMLIAIMGDTFDRVKSEEDVQIIIGRARFIDAYEASLSAQQISEVEKNIGRFLCVISPKDGEHITKTTNWKGRINAIEENLKKAVDFLEASVQNVIEKNKEAIKDNRDKMENIIKQQFEQNRVLLQEQLEEHRKTEQGLIHSIVERINDLEMKADRETPLVSRISTQPF